MYVCLVISMTCIEKKMSNPKLLRKDLELVTYEIGNEKKRSTFDFNAGPLT